MLVLSRSCIQTSIGKASHHLMEPDCLTNMFRANLQIAQRNFEIAHIAKMRGTYILHNGKFSTIFCIFEVNHRIFVTIFRPRGGSAIHTPSKVSV